MTETELQTRFAAEPDEIVDHFWELSRRLNDRLMDVYFAWRTYLDECKNNGTPATLREFESICVSAS